MDALRNGTIDNWLARPRECLAGIILMDQFTRNIYRGTPDMYAYISSSINVVSRYILAQHRFVVSSGCIQNCRTKWCLSRAEVCRQMQRHVPPHIRGTCSEGNPSDGENMHIILLS